MKIGDHAKIWQKPATDEDFEGIARLVKHVGGDLGAYQRWLVEFEDEPGEHFERSVCENHVRQAAIAKATETPNP